MAAGRRVGHVSARRLRRPTAGTVATACRGCARRWRDSGSAGLIPRIGRRDIRRRAARRCEGERPTRCVARIGIWGKWASCPSLSRPSAQSHNDEAAQPLTGMRRFNMALARCSFSKDRCGGPEGIRTPDLLDANEARYQLRHRPGQLDNTITPSVRAETIPAAPPAVSPLHMLRAACRVDGATAARANTYTTAGEITTLRPKERPTRRVAGSARRCAHAGPPRRRGPTLRTTRDTTAGEIPTPRSEERPTRRVTDSARRCAHEGPAASTLPRPPVRNTCTTAGELPTPRPKGSQPAVSPVRPAAVPARGPQPQTSPRLGTEPPKTKGDDRDYSPEARRASSRCT